MCSCVGSLRDPRVPVVATMVFGDYIAISQPYDGPSPVLCGVHVDLKVLEKVPLLRHKLLLNGLQNSALIKALEKLLFLFKDLVPADAHQFELFIMQVLLLHYSVK